MSVCFIFIRKITQHYIQRGAKKEKAKTMDFWKPCKLPSFLSSGIEGLVLTSFFGILYKAL